MKRSGTLIIVVLLALAPFTAVAHTQHETDADDTDRPVDIASVKFGHSKKQFTFTIRSFEPFDLQGMLASDDVRVWVDMAPDELDTYYWLQADREDTSGLSAVLKAGPTYDESEVVVDGLSLQQINDTKIRFKLPRRYLEGFDEGSTMGWAPWVEFPDEGPCYGGVGCGDRAPDEGVFTHKLNN